MEAVSRQDGLAQFLQLVSAARVRNTGVGSTGRQASTRSASTLASISADPAAPQRIMAAQPGASESDAAGKNTARYLGTRFDAYA